MNKDNFDFDNVLPEASKKKYSDLDLGLDFDLSFLDDVDESVLEGEPSVDLEIPEQKEEPVKKAELVKKAPAKKVVKKTAPSDATPEAGEIPVKKAVKKAPADAPKKKAPVKREAVPAEEPVKAKKQKKGPRVGSVIFYTIYFLFILAFFVATYLGLSWLHGWLSDFEAAQPTLKAQQVF